MLNDLLEDFKTSTGGMGQDLNVMDGIGFGGNMRFGGGMQEDDELIQM